MSSAGQAKNVLVAYDLFLAGPWDRYARVPYKSILKKVFPDLVIYDPEDHQGGGEWHISNFAAITTSRAMFVMVPEFPFPGAAMESGMFFVRNSPNGPTSPLKELVFLWPEQVQPAWGRDVAARHGYVFADIESAIVHLESVLIG